MRPAKWILLFAVGLLSGSALASAAPTVQLTADDLLEMAKPAKGECYLVQPSAERLPEAPEKLFAFAAAWPGDFVALRVPVPADGYYSIRSLALWGPWAPGRLGRFTMSAGELEFPGVYQGWYGIAPDTPLRLRDIEWGIAYLSAPATEVHLALSSGGSGRLLMLADLRLEPRAQESLKPEDLQRRVTSAPEPETQATGPRGQFRFDLKQLRGLEWSTLLPQASQLIVIDGNFDEWSQEQPPIVIDSSIVPARGWGAPKPESDADLSAQVRLCWDARFLYVAAQIRDDELQAKSDEDTWRSPYEHDGLVVNVAPPEWLTEGPRSTGPASLLATFGLNYCSPGAQPRELVGKGEYVVRQTAEGYLLEAALPFSVLGWSPAQVGDRFPLGLILVDRDPQKPGGKQFDQYGWNFGPGSAAGMGEARLLGQYPAAGEIMSQHERVTPGARLRFIGSLDMQHTVKLRAIELVRVDSGETVAEFALNRRLIRPGRYRLQGELPLPDLPPGEYDLQLRWE